MKIGLDYDNTYDRAPALWDGFIALAKADGHDIRCVTHRHDLYDRTAPIIKLEKLVEVIYTRGVAKLFFLEHVYEGDFVPEAVIDDKPGSWLENSSTTPEDLAEWRATRGEGPSC